MFRKSGTIDKTLVFFLAFLVLSGALIFSSAAFGLLARGASSISSVAFNHLALGVGLGLTALIATATIDYRQWRRFAPYIFGVALTLTALVFAPGIGFEHGGGQRWLSIFGFSVQPSEFLKLAIIIISAAYFASIKGEVASIRFGLGGFLVILLGPVLLLSLQPDFGTLGIITIAASAVFFGAGASIRQIVIMIIIGALSLGAIALFKPYARDRITTFLNPAEGQRAEGYQIKQSLIAIGSGGLLGRGFGQGVQKFTYLPEPMGDSIFAVAGEEFGFVGSVALVAIFLGFALRGYAIASRSPDLFGALLAIGISTYLVGEAFINIASMLGVAPLTGVPLTFMSQGGTAMLVSLASAGILLNVSRHRTARG